MVMWNYEGPGVVYRRHSASGWSAPRLVSANPTPTTFDSVRLVASSSLVYEVIPEGFQNNVETLHFQEDNGAKVLHPLTLGQASQPAIAVDGSGTVHVLAQTGGIFDGGNIVEWRITTVGVVCGPFVLQAAGASPNGGAQLVSDGMGGLVATWSGTSGIVWSHYRAGTWSTPTRLTGPAFTRQGTLVSNGTRVVFTFARDKGGIFAMTYNGRAWSGEEPVNPQCCGGYPAVRTDGLISIEVFGEGVYTQAVGSTSWKLSGPAFPYLNEYCSYEGPYVYDGTKLVGFTNPFDPSTSSCSVETFTETTLGRVTCSLTPSAGHSGTPVSLRCSGFASNEPVSATYATGLTAPSSVTVCTGSSQVEGTFSCTGTIPAAGSSGARGAHVVTVAGGTSGQIGSVTYVLTG
jgi:hypothetical protein